MANHYSDNFAHNHLPPAELMATCLHDDFEFPEELNCVDYLLDRHIREGNGHKIAIQSSDESWTYNDVFQKSNQIAQVLIDNGLESGNRVLIRSFNNPMFVACWFGILKAGGIVVATMPLLRTKELTTMIDCAEIAMAVCDSRISEELLNVKSTFLKRTIFFDGLNQTVGELQGLMQQKSTAYSNFTSKPDSVAIIGFTSGTTGNPKMTAHYHKDILLVCEAFPQFALQVKSNDIFTGSPPLGFTFGLGGMVLFPFYFGASTVLIEKPSPETLLQAIQQFQVTICFTAPTAWRNITSVVKDYNISSLRKCISAGESLPAKVWQDWYDTTGLKIIDGIGSTEILHIFISTTEDICKPGSTGIPVTGYEAKIVDKDGNTLPINTPGRLAVRGLTGCKYLNRLEKQAEYVEAGWNITGDIFKKDDDGHYWFIARGDDMIISSGYNIGAIEVESVLLQHPDVSECAVVGLPDSERGMLVCANIVLKNYECASNELVLSMQNWFKQHAAPYKYPRVINFVEILPKTETGKIQRFKLKN